MYLPEGSLAVSVASTVWVGVLVVCFYNLRLGWSLSGLVIPGYLAPLFIAKPISGIIDVIEGLLAYSLVWIISVIGINSKRWDSFFGRDRFFSLILSTVLIRLAFDGCLFPVLADFLQEHYNYQIDYRSDLNGYGIVVIALIANQFWRDGFKREILPFSITLLTTILLVRYGLMEFSNFRISQIISLYSSIDEAFASGSKIYIILLTTTLIASRMTHKHGWDYGGILVAGLLALQWHSPLRITMTIVESTVIYFICNFILNSTIFDSKNIVGARKILLFFNVGFLYKILLGDFAMASFPEERVLEFYGFGYLLSTLIALRMHENGSAPRVAIMTLATSFAGIVVGSIIAFGLYIVSGSGKPLEVVIKEPVVKENKQIQYQKNYLIGYIKAYKIQTTDAALTVFYPPSLDEIYHLDRDVVEPIVHIVMNRGKDDQELTRSLNKINAYAYDYGYQVKLFDDITSKQKLIILAPADDAVRTKNWGLYIFRLQSNNDQLFEVPRPFDEASTLDFAAFMFQKIGGQFLLIAGTSSEVNRDRSSDFTRPQSKRSLYNLVSQVLLRSHAYNRPVIQVRGYSLSIDSNIKADTDVLIAFSDGAVKQSQLTPAQETIVKLIEQNNLSYNIVSADEKTSGYEVGELFLSKYLIQTPNKDMAIMWLSPWLRSSFRNPESNFLSQSKYETVQIPMIKESLSNFLHNSNPVSGWIPDQNLKSLVETYLRSGDIVALKDLRDLKNYKFVYLILLDDGREYLAVFNNKDQLLGLVSLAYDSDDKENYKISIDASSRLDLSIKRWIVFVGS